MYLGVWVVVLVVSVLSAQSVSAEKVAGDSAGHKKQLRATLPDILHSEWKRGRARILRDEEAKHHHKRSDCDCDCDCDTGSEEESTVDGCGRTPIPPKVFRNYDTGHFGSIEAWSHSWPWLVRLRSGARWHSCSGALIGEQWVLSLKSCASWMNSAGNGTGVVVVGGSHKEEQARCERTMQVEHIYSKEILNDKGWGSEGVILIKLSEKVQFGKTIQPVCLPYQDEQLRIGAFGMTAGWGYLQERDKYGEFPKRVHQKVLPIMDRDLCNSKDVYKGRVTENEYCMGYDRQGVTYCFSDSGAPMMNMHNEKWVLHGLTQYGDWCVRNGDVPGLYVRVSSYVDWIQATISENS